MHNAIPRFPSTQAMSMRNNLCSGVGPCVIIPSSDGTTAALPLQNSSFYIQKSSF